MRGQRKAQQPWKSCSEDGRVSWTLEILWREGARWSGTAQQETNVHCGKLFRLLGLLCYTVSVTLTSTAGAWCLLPSVSLSQRFILFPPGQSQSWPLLDETLAMADHTRCAFKISFVFFLPLLALLLRKHAQRGVMVWSSRMAFWMCLLDIYHLAFHILLEGNGKRSKTNLSISVYLSIHLSSIYLLLLTRAR